MRSVLSALVLVVLSGCDSSGDGLSIEGVNVTAESVSLVEVDTSRRAVVFDYVGVVREPCYETSGFRTSGAPRRLRVDVFAKKSGGSCETLGGTIIRERIELRLPPVQSGGVVYLFNHSDDVPIEVRVAIP